MMGRVNHDQRHAVGVYLAAKYHLNSFIYT